MANEKLVAFRLTADDKAILERLQRELATTASEVIRRLLRWVKASDLRKGGSGSEG